MAITNLNDFFSSTAFHLVLTSGVVAALLTCLFNYLSIRSTNNRLLQIERQKRSHDIGTQRLTMLRGALDDLSKLASTGESWTNALLGKANLPDIAAAEAKKFMEVRSIYDRSMPFLDTDLISPIENIKKDQLELAHKMASGLDSPSDDLKLSLNSLLALYTNFETVFRTSLGDQIVRLLRNV